MIRENKQAFSWFEYDLGKTNLIEHIDTGVNQAIKQQLYCVPATLRNEIKVQLDNML